ncbi:MAG TPA: FMN-binding protein [Planctomycetota bacterium]|nr:FMN-binding protein [Planctomycetota bacterium]
MSHYTRFTLVLTIVCVSAAAGVGGVYLLTREPIARKALENAREARTQVLPDASSFEPIVDTGVYAGLDAEGRVVGWVADGASGGYGGKLTVMLGLGTDDTVAGVTVLAHHETPGLGAECAKVLSDDTLWMKLGGHSAGATHSWLDQFVGKREDQLKLGAGIDARTGCTITSRAITAAARDAVARITAARKRSPDGNQP